MCSSSVHVAPFGALRFVGSRYHGFHPWLQHAVPPGLLPPKGGALDKHSAQKKCQPLRERSVPLGSLPQKVS